MKSFTPIRGTLWVLVAVMAMFVMAASSPQCARSGDYATNPSFDTLAQDPCKLACLTTFKSDKKAEQSRHKLANKACNGDLACKAAESALHEQLVAELVLIKDACLEACNHQQGGGLGGQ